MRRSLLVDLDVDILGLGQHRDGGGRGVDAALPLSVAGTRWTRCTPLSNFSSREHALRR